MRLRRGETAPALLSRRLTSLLSLLDRDHLRRPRGAHEPFRARTPTRKVARFAAGAQIITREAHHKTQPVHPNVTAPQLELVRRYVTTTLLCE